jgi:glycosyltransferase involved in cell wall biosynthesis
MIPIAKPLISEDDAHGMISVPDQGTAAGTASRAKSAVVIYGRLDYLVLGTLVTVARGFSNDVFVSVEQEDSRVSSLVSSLGARVIGPGRDRTLEVIMASYGAVVAMRGDGTDDPYLIPDLLYHIREGHDAAIVASGTSYNHDESVLLLNHRLPPQATPGFVALSRHAASRMKLKKGTSPGKQMADYVKSAGLQAVIVSPGGDSQVFDAYRIGVVVPAYNEELLLGETVRGMPDYVTKIYVIDDCSTDRTPEVIKGLDDPRVVSLRHVVNTGVGGSIVDGYKMALKDGMDLVAVMAGDNQMDPAELPKLLTPVIDGRADYAKGNRLLNRQMRKGMSNWRQLGNNMLTMLNKIGSGYWQISDPQNGYTVISRRALEMLDLDAVYTYYGYCNDLLVKLNTFGLRTLDVPIPARYGNEKSKIRYGRFITRVAPMLFWSFLRRLRVKYTVLDFHPLVLFYATGMVLVPAGLFLGLLSIVLLPFAAGTFVLLGLFATIVTLAGVQSLFTAMAMDWQADCLNRAGERRHR